VLSCITIHKCRPGVTLSYLVAAVAALVSALCYAEFAVDVPISGGAFTYASVTFGELTAWSCGWSMSLETTLSSAAVARGFSGYVATLLGVSPLTLSLGQLHMDWVALFLIGILTTVLCIGIRESARFNMGVCLMNLSCIVFVVLSGLPKADVSNLSPFLPYGMKGVFSASSIVFFSYIGFDYISNAAEEAKNPKRDLPLSIIGSLVVATVLYFLMSFTMVLMVPFSDINIDSPFSSGFISLDMKIASFVVSVGALCGIMTSTMTGLLSQTRLLVVLGREHFLPPALARVSSVTNTPLVATVCTGLCSGILALLVNISFLAELVSAGTLYIFFLTCLGILFKRYKRAGCNPVRRIVGILGCLCASSILMSASYLSGAPWFIIVLMSGIWMASLLSARLFLEADFAGVHSNSFQVPLFPFLPSLGVLFTIHLMCSLSWLAFLEYCIFMLIGIAVYAFYSSARVEQREIELSKQRQRHSQEAIGLVNEDATEQAIQMAETSNT